MKKKYDIVIIGSGLGGLVSANILARHGYAVCVLEKNRQFGGNLQTFVRDTNIFDTGVHYVGGLGKGEILNQYFTYLGIMDKLHLQKLDPMQFDIISFGDSQGNFNYAQGYQNFEASLRKQFPKDHETISKYCIKIKEFCAKFPLYNLSFEERSYSDEDLSLNLKEYLDSISDNDLLKAVLVGSNFLYAGNESTPFYVHALSVNSFLLSAWRFVNGGGQIARQLIRRIKEFGGEVYNRNEVVDFIFENESLSGVVTNHGVEIRADKIISNVDPKLTLKILNGRGLKKAYVNRINNIKNVASGFSMYLVFKPNSFRYVNSNYYHFKNVEKVWKAQEYSERSWPEAFMISMGVKKGQSEWTDHMTAMTYMNYEEIKKWENTFNTVSRQADRGESYQEFKREKTEIFIDALEKKFPNIRDCIQAVYTSTPLSYRDYIGSDEGAMYGYQKDARSPMKSFISPKTKIPNLYLTGQSLNMHGVLGVTISGVLTCSHILGREKLIKNIIKHLDLVNEK